MGPRAGALGLGSTATSAVVRAAAAGLGSGAPAV